MTTDELYHMYSEEEYLSREGYHIYAKPTPATDQQIGTIDRLLHTSTLDVEQRSDIERRMPGMEEEEAQDCIQMLYANQQQTDKEYLKRVQVND